ncbi:hypothetical protein DH09_11735 [Bacillaceae bacterium JMAK1]|nr:hypothetical protein DH09_11735 [Bacillaceae bacterium JMAK1]
MVDLLIIGAGPAGLAASIEAASRNLSVTIIDEFTTPGGRLLGQLHEEEKDVWWNGVEEAHTLHEKAQENGVELLLETSVYKIQQEDVYWSTHTSAGIYHSKALLIATGATEQSLPLPGWTLPGVMSIGAAQVMTNVRHVKPGEKGIIIGLNALSFAISRELRLCNIDLEGFFLPPDHFLTTDQAKPLSVLNNLMTLSHLAPMNWMRLGGKIANNNRWIQKQTLSFYPKRGINIWQTPVHVRKAVTSINGSTQVESVTVVDLRADGTMIEGSEENLEVDFVCISGGLAPLTELIGLTDLKLIAIESLGGYVPVHFEDMRTEVTDLYVAGNITGIESAKVARAQGVVAGISACIHSFNLRNDDALEIAMEKVRKERAEAKLQFHPEIEKGRTLLYSEKGEVQYG